MSKALLYRWNFVVPKSHDLSQDLKEIKDLCSQEFQKELPSIIKLSKELRRNREKAFYGDEEEGITPDEFYTQEQAEEYYKKINDFYNLVYNELEEYLNNN